MGISSDVWHLVWLCSAQCGQLLLLQLFVNGDHCPRHDLCSGVQRASFNQPRCTVMQELKALFWETGQKMRISNTFHLVCSFDQALVNVYYVLDPFTQVGSCRSHWNRCDATSFSWMDPRNLLGPVCTLKRPATARKGILNLVALDTERHYWVLTIINSQIEGGKGSKGYIKEREVTLSSW